MKRYLIILFLIGSALYAQTPLTTTRLTTDTIRFRLLNQLPTHPPSGVKMTYWQNKIFNTDSTAHWRLLDIRDTANLIATKNDLTAFGAETYELEMIADDENDFDVGFTLTSTTSVYFDGKILPSTKWSGTGGSTLHLDLDTRIYDFLIVIRNDINSGLDWFEQEISFDGENNINAGFTLTTKTRVFFNGYILPSTSWTGVGSTSIALSLNTKIYDYVLIFN